MRDGEGRQGGRCIPRTREKGLTENLLSKYTIPTSAQVGKQAAATSMRSGKTAVLREMLSAQWRQTEDFTVGQVSDLFKFRHIKRWLLYLPLLILLETMLTIGVGKCGSGP